MQGYHGVASGEGRWGRGICGWCWCWMTMVVAVETKGRAAALFCTANWRERGEQEGESCLVFLSEMSKEFLWLIFGLYLA